jgi:ribosomal peptide maturation radical SAM protein 1
MPWASTSRPSLPLSLLAAVTRRAGHRCTVHYANLGLATRLGVIPYEAMAEETSFFALDEHLFAVDLFGPDRLAAEDFLTGMANSDDEEEVRRHLGALRRLRDEVVPEFLERTCDEVLALHPEVVGMTCTFNQTMASLALARRLKQRAPAIRTVLGGPSVHDPMGVALAGAFAAEVDHVFTGEADESFVEFLAQVSAGQDEVDVAGVTTAGGLRRPATQVRDLDSSPVPDFGDFFAERSRLVDGGLAVARCTALPYESSRGCWWGAKHHCVFCGLNSAGMAFRSKSPRRVVSDLQTLSEAHGMTAFMAADNILDFASYDGLLDELAGLPVDLDLFYEIKANVKRRHVRKLAAAGVTAVQPGVESFSDHVLELMDKGVNSLQIVQMLKFAAEQGINVIYNVLVGFPGETVEDYAEMLRVIRTIRHLPPPSGASGVVEVHRYSPFHAQPGKYGLEAVRPCGYYAHLIPLQVLAPESFAFFYERSLPPDAPVHAARPELDRALAEWRATSRRRTARLGGSFVEVTTTESGTEAHAMTIRGPAAVALVALDHEMSIPRLTSALSLDSGRDVAEVEGAIDALVQAGLVLRVGDRAVSVVPFARPQDEERLLRWLRVNAAEHVAQSVSWGRRTTRPTATPVLDALPAPGSTHAGVSGRS